MEGVEPPTAWFVARYSIQLSYMRFTIFYHFRDNGGEGGIRTLDTGLGYTPLAGERLQPLGHFTKSRARYYLIQWIMQYLNNDF